MTKRGKLRLDGLAVESFATEAGERADRGTVQGYVCTAGVTCRCPTSYAQCGTGPATIHSCQRTVFDCA